MLVSNTVICRPVVVVVVWWLLHIVSSGPRGLRLSYNNFQTFSCEAAMLKFVQFQRIKVKSGGKIKIIVAMKL